MSFSTELKEEIEKAVLEGNIIRLSGGEPCCDYVACFEIAKYVKENVQKGDIVFTMGAGDVTDIGCMLTEN